MKLFILLFLSLTPAIAKYVKTGCSDKCGNVRIPYPFGIGAECSVNQWYTVDCKNSSPYLSKLNHLEVLGISLKNQTVTVSMPRISDCHNPFRNSSLITSFDLDGSPFLFSKSHNKFVFEGCGSAAMMNNGSVVTGCSSACPNVTVSYGNNCFGIGCCQTAISHYLKSYKVNLTGLERQGKDGGCGSAFLVEDETLYEQGRFSDKFNFKKNIPVSLLWTLKDSDLVSCCYDESPETRTVKMFNGNSLDTLKCNYYSESSLEVNPYLTDGCKHYGT
ncbi:putative wall-associated receptor kinase [Helianthus annuus]|nr:putative wall-associated receptor kinase [Helianthus annuus]